MDRVPPDRPEPVARAPVDLQLHKLARDLEAEFGGLFGIDRRDIERAILRANGSAPVDPPETVLPDTVRRAVVLLDAVVDLAGEAFLEKDFTTIAVLLEMLEHTRGRIRRQLDDDST